MVKSEPEALQTRRGQIQPCSSSDVKHYAVRLFTAATMFTMLCCLAQYTYSRFTQLVKCFPSLFLLTSTPHLPNVTMSNFTYLLGFPQSQ